MIRMVYNQYERKFWLPDYRVVLCVAVNFKVTTTQRTYQWACDLDKKMPIKCVAPAWDIYQMSRDARQFMIAMDCKVSTTWEKMPRPASIGVVPND